MRGLRSIANIVEKRKYFLFIHILNMTLFTVFEKMQPQVTKEKPPQTITLNETITDYKQSNDVCFCWKVRRMIEK